MHTLFRLGSANTGSVMAAYRDLTSDSGLGLLIIAVLHIDFAEDQDDSELLTILNHVLSATEVSVPIDTPSTVLTKMHEIALDAGKYFSAAVIRFAEDETFLALSGFAMLNKFDPQRSLVIGPETLEGVETRVLSNALGVDQFLIPSDVTLYPKNNVYIVTVGGICDFEHIPYNTELAERFLVAQDRGGIGVLLK